MRGEMSIYEQSVKNPFKYQEQREEFENLINKVFGFTPDHESVDFGDFHTGSLVVRLAGGRNFLSSIHGARTLEAYTNSTSPSAPSPNEDEVNATLGLTMLLDGKLKSRGFFVEIFRDFADVVFVKIIESKLRDELLGRSASGKATHFLQWQKQAADAAKRKQEDSLKPLLDENVLVRMLEMGFNVLRGWISPSEMSVALMCNYLDGYGLARAQQDKKAAADTPKLFDLVALLSGWKRTGNEPMLMLEPWIKRLLGKRNDATGKHMCKLLQASIHVQARTCAHTRTHAHTDTYILSRAVGLMRKLLRITWTTSPS